MCILAEIAYTSTQLVILLVGNLNCNMSQSFNKCANFSSLFVYDTSFRHVGAKNIDLLLTAFGRTTKVVQLARITVISS